MLETIWFLLWGALWAVYFVLDGYDLGIGTLIPFLGKSDTDRRVMLNAMGPFWDGNEVWLITAGGVTFAAFPKAYAVMFSGLYTPLMLLLFALIIRGVSLEFRHQVDSTAWRRVWDWGATLGSFLPALLLGVAFANIFMGLPLDEKGVFQGNLLTLLNPYGLAGGVLFVLLFAMHGTLWLAIKSEGDLQRRAANLARKLWPVLVVLIGAFVVLTVIYTNLLGNYLTNPLLLVLLVAHFLARFQQSHALTGILSGIRPAALGLLGSAVVFLAQGSLVVDGRLVPMSVAIAAIVLALAFWKKIHPITLTVAAGIAGAFLIR